MPIYWVGIKNGSVQGEAFAQILVTMNRIEAGVENAGMDE